MLLDRKLSSIFDFSFISKQKTFSDLFDFIVSYINQAFRQFIMHLNFFR